MGWGSSQRALWCGGSTVLTNQQLAMSQTPRIFIITGTPGSGKTSVATGLMRRFPFGLHIPVDDLREWVISGIVHPVPVWTEEAGRQFRFARQAAAQVARIYAAGGFAVAIDDVISPSEAQELFAVPLAGYALHTVLLRPALEIALERNARRTSKAFDTEVLADPIARLYRAMDVSPYIAAGWIIIDNSTLSTEETVDHILDAVNRWPKGAENHADNRPT